MEGQLRPPATLGRELAHSMAKDQGRDLTPIAEAGSTRFRSLHTVGGARPEPWVLDSNELYNAILYTARTGVPSLLARAASTGVITWYIAEHVANEVDAHLDEWAATAGIDAPAAWDAWQTAYQPMLRLVSSDLTELAFTTAERQRLARLDTRDPDDLPTARLAIALGARLATRDGALLEATYGPGRASSDHAGELIPTASALTASHQLHEMETLALLLPAAMVAEAARLLRRFPLLGAVGTGAATLALRSPEQRRHLQTSAQRFWTVLVAALEIRSSVHDTINEQLARYEPVLGSLATTAEELDTDARPRIAMWMLARRCQVDASAADLASDWPSSVQHLRSTAAIRSILHTGSVFTETSRGRFQFGTPLQPPT